MILRQLRAMVKCINVRDPTSGVEKDDPLGFRSMVAWSRFKRIHGRPLKLFEHPCQGDSSEPS